MKSAITSNTPSTRLAFIDIARTFAVFFALFSHAIGTAGFIHQLDSDALILAKITKFATPLFVFMFGFMVEFVYVRKAERAGIGSIYNRILIRSFQCYVAYVLTSFCAYLGDYKSIEGFFASLLFFSDSRFGNILRTYSVMLLLTPFIINLRIRFGVKFLFFSFISLIISYTFISELKLIEFGIFNNHFNIFLGIGPVENGPSVYGALSFYLAGMIMASSLSQDETGITNKISCFYVTSFLLAAILLILGALLIKENANEAWELFTNYSYRKYNAAGYYIIGTLGGVSIMFLFYFLIGAKTPFKSIALILPVGTSSLISYTAGNVILNLLGEKVKDMNLIVFILLFFLAITLISRYIHKMPFYIFFTHLMNFKYTKTM